MRSSSSSCAAAVPVAATVLAVAVLTSGIATAQPDPSWHDERPDMPRVVVPRAERVTRPPTPVVRGPFVSVQVNVDGDGLNIVGDAANEPSIAVDPTDPSRISIGWRQFDTIASNFRQAGFGFSTDGGATWTFPGVIEPGVFRSDPVLEFDSAGRFFYYSLSIPGGDLITHTFPSTDGGQTWGAGVFSHGGDKAWIDIDRSPDVGAGNVYANWTSGLGCCGPDHFNRSTDGGASFEAPFAIPGQPFWGTVHVADDGTVFVAGAGGALDVQLAISTTLEDPGEPPGFDTFTAIDLGGDVIAGEGPNPGGLLGQVWVATEPDIILPTKGLGPLGVYVLASVDPPGPDPLDVHFVSSSDGGASFGPPVRVNDDPPGTDAWQWFGTMSVAPIGRIDVVWNDSRGDPGGFDSRLYYSFSHDGGLTFSPNIALTPPFDPHLGWPQQSKLGDYYDMVSDDTGAHLTYAATFNGEQDVYYLHLTPIEGGIFADGFESGDASAWQ